MFESSFSNLFHLIRQDIMVKNMDLGGHGGFRGPDDLTPLFFRVRLAYSMQCYASMHQTSEDSFIADRDARLVVSFDFQVVKSLCPEIRSRQVMAR